MKSNINSTQFQPRKVPGGSGAHLPKRRARTRCSSFLRCGFSGLGRAGARRGRGRGAAADFALRQGAARGARDPENGR